MAGTITIMMIMTTRVTITPVTITLAMITLAMITLAMIIPATATGLVMSTARPTRSAFLSSPA